jgi:hypothetical protein
MSPPVVIIETHTFTEIKAHFVDVYQDAGRGWTQIIHLKLVVSALNV